MAKNIYSITFGDVSREKSTVSVYLPDTPSAPALTAFDSRLSAATLGTWMQDQVSTVTRWSNEFPSNSNAERETKLLVTYQDAVTLDIYTFSIPTVDRTYFPRVVGTDFVNIVAAGLGLDFKNEIEALLVSPDGNAVTVLQMKYVGRNT